MIPTTTSQPMMSDQQVEEQALQEFVSSTLEPQQIQYLEQALVKDPTLATIVDALMIKAVEFSDDGEVEGPGTGMSDQIPARLSDGEFVFSAKAVAAIGVDVLQKMMKDAEASVDAMQAQRGTPNVADTTGATSLLERTA